jgi:hypothetical protein
MHMRLEEILANKFIRITLMIFFLLFIYKILFAIGLFFAIEIHILSMYLCWITMLVLFASMLPFKQYQFTVSKNESADESTTGPLLKLTQS